MWWQKERITASNERATELRRMAQDELDDWERRLYDYCQMHERTREAAQLPPLPLWGRGTEACIR